MNHVLLNPIILIIYVQCNWMVMGSGSSMLFDFDSFPQFHGNLVGISNCISKPQFLKS